MSVAVCRVRCRCSVNRPPVCGWFICRRLSNVLSTVAVILYVPWFNCDSRNICFHETAVLRDYLCLMRWPETCIMYKAHNVVCLCLFVGGVSLGQKVYNVAFTPPLLLGNLRPDLYGRNGSRKEPALELLSQSRSCPLM